MASVLYISVESESELDDTCVSSSLTMFSRPYLHAS